jgi:hypothetical protein
MFIDAEFIEDFNKALDLAEAITGPCLWITRSIN